MNRLEARRHAEGHVRIEERRMLDRDDEVDFAQHVEGSTAGHTVDGRYDRFPQVVGLWADVLARIIHMPRCGRRRPGPSSTGSVDVLGRIPAPHDLAAVYSDAERLVAGTRKHHATNVIVPA